MPSTATPVSLSAKINNNCCEKCHSKFTDIIGKLSRQFKKALSNRVYDFPFQGGTFGLY